MLSISLQHTGLPLSSVNNSQLRLDALTLLICLLNVDSYGGHAAIHLGLKSLTEKKVNNRVQADVENRHYGGRLLQVVQHLNSRAVFRQRNIGESKQVIGHKTHTENADK